MQIQLKPAYIPWLFDSRSAWNSAVADARFRYDMSFDAFMLLYMEHRENQLPAIARTQVPTMPLQAMAKSSAQANTSLPETSSTTSSGASQLLSQNEIDALINSMSA